MYMESLEKTHIPHIGRWWRFSHYEVRDRIIQPVTGATLEEYDPWSEYQRSRTWGDKGSAPPPPYQALLALKQHLRLDVNLRLTRESEEAVLAWCNRYGLLGLLPHYFDHLPPEIEMLDPAVDGPAYAEPDIRYQAGEWRETERRYAPFHPFDSQKLQLFFPKLELEPWPPTNIPEPLTEDFWKAYGEPVDYFMAHCTALADAVQVLSSVSAEEPPDSWQVEESADSLNLITASVAPAIHFDDKSRSFTLRWHYRSLLASLAMMILQDLAKRRRVYTCQNCGTVFLSHSPKALYCDKRCRNTAEKRRKRQRDREMRQKEEEL